MSVKTQSVLLASYFFPPTNSSGIYRILAFAKYLPDFGISPIILTSSQKSGREPLDKDLLEKVPEDLTIHHMGTGCLPSPEGSGISRKIFREVTDQIDHHMPIDPFLLFGLFGSIRARRLIKKHSIEAVITSSPPHSIHLIGYVFKKYFGIPWIADFRDRIGHKPFAPGEGNQNGRFSLMGKLERSILETADATIANTPANLETLVSSYPDCRERVVCIPNGYDPADFENSLISNERKEEQDRKLQVIYTGEMYEGMGDTLWQGLSILKKNNPEIANLLELKIVGIMTENDRKKIKDNHLDDIVKFLGFVKEAECRRLLSISDVALLLLPKEGYPYWIPSKVYTYFGSGTYVLAILPEGDALNLVKGVNAGICIPPSPEKIAETLSTLVSLHCSGNMKASYNLSELKKYTRPYHANQLAEMIHKITSPA